MTTSADPDQLASSEANWPGSTLFAKTGHYLGLAGPELRKGIAPKAPWPLLSFLMSSICQKHLDGESG